MSEVLHQVVAHLRTGQWRAAHDQVQQASASPLSAWLHGLLHIYEGDLEDAEYWYGVAGRHFRSRGTFDEELERFEAQLRQVADPLQP